MNILEILTSPWAIQPEKLIEIQDIYAARSRGEHADFAAIEARLGRPLENETQRYTIVDGVAVVPVMGVMARRMNLFSAISGGMSTQLVARDIQAAAADPAAHSIILRIDSPGGEALGTQSLAQAIYAVREKKPIVAFGEGMTASAAYWIAAATSRIYIAEKISQIGSIGVVAKHIDISKSEEKAGIKTTEITAGKFKRIASEYEPLTADGRAEIQATVDYLYSIFVNDVAAYRGTSVEKVLADMADGRVFIGDQAITAGLADEIISFDALITRMNQERNTFSVAPIRPTTQGTTMNMEELLAAHPELVNQIRAEGRDEGRAQERDRIQSVEAQLMPGHEALIATLKFDGKTTGPEAAAAVIKAERSSRNAHLEKMRTDAPPPVAHAPVPAAAQVIDPNLPVEARCKAQWEASAELQNEFTSLAAYTAFTKQTEAGNARIYKAK